MRWPWAVVGRGEGMGGRTLAVALSTSPSLLAAGVRTSGRFSMLRRLVQRLKEGFPESIATLIVGGQHPYHLGSVHAGGCAPDLMAHL